MGHYVSVLARGAFPRMRTLRKTDELRSFFQVFIDAVGNLKEREARHVELLESTLAAMKVALPRAPELAEAIVPLERVRTGAPRRRPRGRSRAHAIVRRPSGRRSRHPREPLVGAIHAQRRDRTLLPRPLRLRPAERSRRLG